MHHGLHVVARPVDLPVDEALQIETASLPVHGHAVEIVLEDVVGGDQLRSQRTCHEVAIGIPVVPDADVAPRVNHAVIGQDAIGGDEVVDEPRGSRARRGR